MSVLRAARPHAPHAVRPPLQGSVLVTGASSGIGRELARQLAPRARALLLAARRADRLQALAAELRARHPALQVGTHACDLGEPRAVEELVEVAEAGGPVDVLVNDAGLGDLQLFEQASWDKLAQMVQVNVLALTRLSYRLLGSMLARGRGGILNVSSAMGLTFLPGMAVYGATKHYVTALSEALRLELRGTGVVVSQLCPGPVGSEFMQVAGNPTGRPVPGWLQLSPERCARVALRGFARGKALIVPGLSMKILLGLGRLAPRPLLRLLYSRVGRWLRLLPPPPTGRV